MAAAFLIANVVFSQLFALQLSLSIITAGLRYITTSFKMFHSVDFTLRYTYSGPGFYKYMASSRSDINTIIDIRL
jgi:hypothetical protein